MLDKLEGFLTSYTHHALNTSAQARGERDNWEWGELETPLHLQKTHNLNNVRPAPSVLSLCKWMVIWATKCQHFPMYNKPPMTCVPDKDDLSLPQLF